jgi:predicted HD superfamily hydrolase involved in NAD metabolism
MYDGAMMTTDLRAELETSVAKLPAGLGDHVSRVVTEARRLAHVHGVDEARAVIAALGHDLYRGHVPDKLLAEAEAGGLVVSGEERSQPILLHGPLGARRMAEHYGIDDEEVLAAARHHTTARAGMSQLEKLIFVADKIEAEKARGEPALAEARQAAPESLDAAMRIILDYQISRALERGWPVHPDTVAARNELL